MSNAIQTEKYKGFTIEIYQDDLGESPRAWDNLGTLICFHPRYDLGDAHEYENPAAAMRAVPRGSVLLPVYMYEHSGITISTSNAGYPFNDVWDSGQVGFIFVSPEKIRAEMVRLPKHENNARGERNPYKPIKRITKKDRARAADCLRGEIKTLDQYLCGDVYGYAVLDADGETLDSCYGYYGMDDVLKEARRAADYQHEHNF